MSNVMASSPAIGTQLMGIGPPSAQNANFDTICANSLGPEWQAIPSNPSTAIAGVGSVIGSSVSSVVGLFSSSAGNALANQYQANCQRYQNTSTPTTIATCCQQNKPYPSFVGSTAATCPKTAVFSDPANTCGVAMQSYCSGLKSPATPFTDPTCIAWTKARALIGDDQYVDGTYQTYCSKNSNMLTDPNCSTWVMNNESNPIVNATMANVCNAGNLNYDPCRTFIQDRSKQTTAYDAVMMAYCKQNPTSSLCPCLVSEINAGGDLSKGSPVCTDPTCTGGIGSTTPPFMTNQMNQYAQQCSYTICQQYVNQGAVVGNNNLNTAQLTIMCGPPKVTTGSATNPVTAITEGSTTTSAQTVGSSTQPLTQQQQAAAVAASNPAIATGLAIQGQTASTPTSSSDYIIIIIIIAVVIAALVGGIYLYKRRSNAAMMQMNQPFAQQQYQQPPYQQQQYQQLPLAQQPFTQQQYPQ